ncbi:MAG: hypothetical protein ACLVB5_14655 [Christensenellales bacterium]
MMIFASTPVESHHSGSSAGRLPEGDGRLSSVRGVSVLTASVLPDARETRRSLSPSSRRDLHFSGVSIGGALRRAHQRATWTRARRRRISSIAPVK